VAEPDVSELLNSAQAEMYAGRLDGALERVETVLGADPGHVDALYMKAVCLRYLKQPGPARQTLTALKAVAPDFGRALQEEGHLYREAGDDRAAIEAYRAATIANPALQAAWSALADALERTGAPAEARQCRAQAEALARLPKPLLAASHHLYENRVHKAEGLARSFLQKNPKHVEGMRILAEIGKRLGVLDDAEFLLESAVEFEPDNIALRLDYIEILRKRQKHEAALEQAAALLKRDPDNPVFLSRHAVECLAIGDYEAALSGFDKVLAVLPEDAGTHAARAHALKTMGHTDEAVSAYRRAYAARPDYGEAYYGLANLKTYRFTDEEIARMQAQEAAVGLRSHDRVHLCFALGKAHEDRADYDRAFEYYNRGNDLKRAQTRYTSDIMAQEFQAQADVCTPDLFEQQGGKGCPAPDPIFIVGLPRAGSTLLEQILASHSQVDGTLELPDILATAHRLRGRNRGEGAGRYPGILHELSAEQLRQLGEDYIENTRIHRQGAPFFTDKMPNNFRHIGLIKLILPNAKIIDARREPMACCFSGFKQLFAEGQEFTYGLDEIGRYYRGYVELMDHWDRVLPGEILRVQYEDVVADLETQVRRILDFCGLPFEQACLDFHATERAVRTASSEQVRQPIYDSGIEQWRHFESHLDPLKSALGPALTGYRSGA
jgi:tetratricopeptide (TPR) repeat protein